MAPALGTLSGARRVSLATQGLLLLGLHAAYGHDYDGCTSIVIGSEATEDGSVYTSHSNDCATCDWRVAYVPARDWPEGSERPILDALWDQYPRQVNPKRSAIYQPDRGVTESKVLGSIPQVPHTYALWEGTYGLMNEHGLGLGESTCSSWLVGNVSTDGGKTGAIFSIGNLMAVALERCKTARCAIETMGDLGERYGFYGEDPGIGGAGEAVTLVDKTGEAWVFHMTGGLPEYPGAAYEGRRGAVWAAQRVPPNHVAVIANSFILREIDPNDKDNFLYHPGIFELTKEAKLWSGEGPFDFQKVLQPDLATFRYFPGEAPIPMYSTLRMWSVFRKLAPSQNLEATPDLSQFPFSVPVDKKVDILEIMNLFRDHYEGTEFDMTLGALAGPWGTPNRAEGGVGQWKVPGQFARAISIPRTSYTVLLQSGTDVKEPLAWYAPDASASSVFVPFFSTVLGKADGQYAVEVYGSGSMKDFSFTSGQTPPAWWAFDFVANWMDLSYHNMSLTYVYPKVQSLQAEVVDKVHEAVEAAAAADSAEAGAQALAEAQTKLQRQVVKEWWDFAGMLVVRYNDQFFNFGENAPNDVACIGYPSYWLEQLGYDQESYRPSWLQKSTVVPAMLPQEARDAVGAGPAPTTAAPSASTTAAPEATPLSGRSYSSHQTAVIAALSSAVALLMGGALGYSLGHSRGKKAGKVENGDYTRML